ncbi:MAG: ParB N-terminal domain-containing protein [Deltaproteobacteria bacterium]|nr:ParB N-terminal domain-containing protein [Deltaproteobacteria bacterium]
MDELCHHIQIVPTQHCLPHEQVTPERVDQIVATIQKEKVLKNPVIVAPYKERYVVLDGTHRFAAVQALQLPTILVYVVDYFSEDVQLLPPHQKETVLERAVQGKLFPPKSTRHLIAKRPLRVDIDLSLLESPKDLKEKNRFLQEHLKDCYEKGSVRFYAESVLIFSD